MKEYIKERINMIEEELSGIRTEIINIRTESNGEVPSPELINRVDIIYKEIYAKQAVINELLEVLDEAN